MKRLLLNVCSLSCFLVALAGCESTKKSNRVIGRAIGPGVPLTTAELITEPGPLNGVRLSTDVGRGERAVTLSNLETMRLIGSIENELKRWLERQMQAPFEETVMLGMATSDRASPFVVTLSKPPSVSAPVFIVRVGFTEGVGGIALDRANAQLWTKHLRWASGN